jgi:hypothetical protein
MAARVGVAIDRRSVGGDAGARLLVCGQRRSIAKII